MRLHVGCGAVLLRDWVNVDLPLPHVFLSKERPDLVDEFISDEANYYGRHSDKDVDALRDGAVIRETVCDVYGSFAFLPVRPNSVTEILSRQVFEHLSRQEAQVALDQCFSVLKVGGLLRIDIPDADETMRLYRQTGDEFYIRHMFGPRRNMFGSHTHYNREMLRKVVEERRFTYCREESNPHWYPAFTLCWRKH